MRRASDTRRVYAFGVKRVFQVVFAIFCVTVAWMAFDNVLTDEEPFRQLAEEKACTVKKCTEKHGLTRMSRTPIGVSIETTWKDGTVNVTCRRQYFVVGARTCSVD